MRMHFVCSKALLARRSRPRSSMGSRSPLRSAQDRGPLDLVRPVSRNRECGTVKKSRPASVGRLF